MSYVDDLSRELGAHGIPGRTRRRILAEVDDHLRSDGDAEARFGSPGEVANAFAAELGAQAVRRGAVGAFAALGLAGAVYALCFVSLPFASSSLETLEPPLAALAFATMIVAPQVSFVAGSLALVRAFRRRRENVLATAELRVISRRTSVALVFGLLTMGALALFGYELRGVLAGWWLSLTYASTAVASVVLVLAALPALSAARVRPQIAGHGGDVFDDVGFARFRGNPWRFAQLIATTVGLAVWLTGVVQGDPLDGFVRGVFEALACLGGFAVFGRYLGLRR